MAEGLPEASPGEATGTGERTEGVGRLVPLSDGIFAIAITLLVLSISVPDDLPQPAFKQAWSQT